MTQQQEEIKELGDKVKYYSKKYYSGEEEISDYEFDKLIEQLKKLDPENSLIPGAASEETNSAGYPKVKHVLTTGTLSKCMTTEDFEDWIKKHPSEEYYASEKIDGLSLEVVYKYSKLHQVISRGNGFYGYDKVQLAEYIPAIPKEINLIVNCNVSIRGELVLPNAIFKKYKYFENMKNPRNAGAGLFNKKISDLTSEEIQILKEMQFYAYDIRLHKLDLDLMHDFHYGTQQKKFKHLEKYGFKVPKHRVCKSLKDILEFQEELAKTRGTEEELHNIDGIVIFEKISDPKEQLADQLEKVQKYATALKFDAEIAIGTILDIEWSLTGSYLTPVAIMTPMQLAGTTVKRASLANLENISKLGIKIGDKVRVKKSGDIIPQVISKVEI